MPSPDTIASLPAALGGLDAFGLLGLAFGIAASFQARRRAVLLCAALASACFGAHFLRLGSATGTAMCLLSLAQNLLAARFVTAAGRPRWLTVAFGTSALASMALTLATWNGTASALCGAGSLLSTCARLQSGSLRMRWLFMGSSACWAGHDLMTGSVPSLTCDLISMAGFATALWREAAARREARGWTAEVAA